MVATPQLPVPCPLIVAKVGYGKYNSPIYFMYLQISFIHAFCIYCLVTAVTTLLLLIAALSHLKVPSVDLMTPAGKSPIQA